MPKAYRTDVVGHQKFQGELGKSRTSKSERVRCPVGDCACNYEMYGSQASTRDRDIATEQVVMQNQANAINAQCNQLRAQRDSIQRMPLPYQQSSPWREQMSDVRARMNQLHC